jgi:hypothetical protein
MKKDTDWVESFIRAFGQDASNSFEFRNQNDFVAQQNKVDDRDQINQINRDAEEMMEKDENLNMHAEDESTGDEYVLELKRTETGPDRKDVNVTFSCLNDRNKYVNSTLEGLCEGRYAGYAGKSLKTIAAVLCNEYEYIFNYVDASLAKYSDALDAERALAVAQLAKDKDGMISYVDYNKIRSKLSSDGLNEFNERLITANIHIYYPTSLIKTSELN